MNTSTFPDRATGTAHFQVQAAAKIAAEAPRRAPKGLAHTPSVDDLYGPLVKAGLVKIVRKKGCAPVIVWL